MAKGGMTRCCAVVLFTLCAGPGWAYTFPAGQTSTTRGAYEGLYFAIRGVDAAPLSATRINQIEASSTTTREFLAANSGGRFDLRYAHILDVPLTLASDGRRIGDWIADAENYVRNQYGLEPEDFHSNVFDVSATTPDENQGWSGLAWIPSNNYAVQADVTSSWGQLVVDHELGHRIGAPHSGAWRSVNDNNWTPYVYDYDQQQYVEYNAAVHGQQPATFGVHNDEYGNPFDVMGNISRGHFSVHEKLTDLDWLTNQQVPDANAQGEGVYRIYAHDQAEAVHNERLDRYGVVDTYRPDVLYGLTYQRTVDEYNPDQNAFFAAQQTITLEYRAGRDGVQFYLNDSILDMDREGGLDRNNQERELEVGQTIRDIDFGGSFYSARGEGEDFLAFNAPAPRRPWEVVSEWLEFTVIEQGADEIGSYVELAVSLFDVAVETLTTGDLNQDGVLTQADWQAFVQNSHADLASLTYTDRYLHGDLDADGDNDYDDFLMFKESYIAANSAAAFAALLTAPEPRAVWLLVGGLCLAVALRR